MPLIQSPDCSKHDSGGTVGETHAPDPTQNPCVCGSAVNAIAANAMATPNIFFQNAILCCWRCVSELYVCAFAVCCVFTFHFTFDIRMLVIVAHPRRRTRRAPVARRRLRVSAAPGHSCEWQLAARCCIRFRSLLCRRCSCVPGALPPRRRCHYTPVERSPLRSAHVGFDSSCG